MRHFIDTISFLNIKHLINSKRSMNLIWTENLRQIFNICYISINPLWENALLFKRPWRTFQSYNSFTWRTYQSYNSLHLKLEDLLQLYDILLAYYSLTTLYGPSCNGRPSNCLLLPPLITTFYSYIFTEAFSIV